MIIRKKARLLIPCIAVGVVAAAAAAVSANASRNARIMQETIDAGLQKLSEKYTVTPMEPSEYTDITLYGVMKFHTDQYRVGRLGNLSVMTTNMGMMQMVSFVLAPYEKDMPLLSMDFMYSMNTRKAYTEFYDLVTDTDPDSRQQMKARLLELTERYAELEEVPAEPAWYDSLLTVSMHKKSSSGSEERIRTMFCDAVETYCAIADTMEPLSPEDAAAKLEIVQQYSDDLVKKGGVSTDVFKKALGEEKTKDFFDKVFFGPAHYTVTE